PTPLVWGHDFFSAPRFSPDGRQLAWLSWDHPRMPWDGTELWVADIDDRTVRTPRLVAGGPDESISQPRWGPKGALWFVSDRTGWWNLYRDDVGGPRPVLQLDAEFSGPDWVFGQSTYCFLGEGRVVAAWWRDAIAHLGAGDAGSGAVEEWASPFTALASLRAYGEGVVAIAASATEEPA